jgi:hypothetical protein
MSEERKPVPLRGPKFIYRISDYLQLVWRLVIDPRVMLLLKGLPAVGVAYALFPLDIPLPIDDIAVMWLASYLFIELCPPEIVAEHRTAIEQIIPANWVDEDETADE